MARGPYTSSNNLRLGSAILQTEPLTFACWFYPNADQHGSLMAVADSGSAVEFRLFVQKAGPNYNLTATANDGTGFGNSLITGVVNVSWQHAVAVFTSDTSRTVYLDGTAGTTNTTSVTVSGCDNTTVGRRDVSANDRYFDGQIADAAIWSSALSQSDVDALNLGISPLFVQPASLISYLPLVRNKVDYMGSVFTETGTVPVTDHPIFIRPPVIWPVHAPVPSGAPPAPTRRIFITSSF